MHPENTRRLIDAALASMGILALTVLGAIRPDFRMEWVAPTIVALALRAHGLVGAALTKEK